MGATEALHSIAPLKHGTPCGGWRRGRQAWGKSPPSKLQSLHRLAAPASTGGDVTHAGCALRQPERRRAGARPETVSEKARKEITPAFEKTKEVRSSTAY